MNTEIKPEILAPVDVRITYNKTVNFASYQNHVPVIRGISITNNSLDALYNLDVVIQSEPLFAENYQVHIDLLNAGEIKQLNGIDIKLSYSSLSSQTEASRGQVIITVFCEGDQIKNICKDIEVLAYDQWAGTRALPELLGAFSVPNNPAVDRLIFNAGELLSRAGHGKLMNGYQSKNRDDVWIQLSAIYNSISAENIHYSEPPASFGTDGQKIRNPERIISSGVATCLDITMLISSCLEQAGLNAIVLLKKGHAWVGCWLTNTTLPTSISEDCQNIRKRVKSGELIVFETTCLTRHPTPALQSACETAVKHLNDDRDFSFALDVRRARMEQIRPLSAASGDDLFGDRPHTQDELPLEAPPLLPPLDVDAISIEENVVVDTPQGRLARWKAKLLDLTLRNRQINFRETKTMLPLYVPDATYLEDAISKGQEWRFRAVKNIMEGDDPRVASIATNRLGEEPLTLMAREAMAQNEIPALVDKKTLDTKLYSIYSAAKLSLEEGGANTLYLAIGFLHWTENKRAEVVYKAPIILVPVTLTRKSVQSGYSIKSHDDETIVNPTLIQLLKEDFQLTLNGLEPVPAANSGVDVGKILQIFRLGIKEITRWEVTEEVYLGTFSFTKYLMWKDLQDRTDDLKKSRIVNHLIERPHESLGIETDISLRNDLDNRHTINHLFTPLLADSSQLNAVSRASEGFDFALEGPPGTGKSQTITNLIAHFLAKGKTVLFVSEKMAALEVVKKRLTSIGLGPFCLELHSAKARKTEVLEQLKTALTAISGFSRNEWDAEASQLTRLRNELDGLVQALHRRSRNGLTPWQAINTVIKYRNLEPVNLRWTHPDMHSAEDLNHIKEVARSIKDLADDLNSIKQNPLSKICKRNWSNNWEENFNESVHVLNSTLLELNDAQKQLGKSLEIDLGTASIQQLERVNSVGQMMLESINFPKSFVTQINDPAVYRKLEILRAHGLQRTTAWNKLSGTFRLEVALLDAKELQQNWNNATLTWWPKSWFAQKKILKRLGLSTRSQTPYAKALYPDFLENLSELNKEDNELKDRADEATNILGDEFKGAATDWPTIESYEQWGRKSSKTIQDLLQQLGDQPSGQISSHLLKLMGDQRHLLRDNEKLRREILDFKKLLNEFHLQLNKVSKLAENYYLVVEEQPNVINDLLGTIEGWKRSAKDIRSWCRWQNISNEAIDLGLAPIIESIEGGRTKLTDADTFVEYCYNNWWLKAITDEEAALRNFSSSNHERKIVEFQRADHDFKETTQKYITSILAAKIPNQGTGQKPDKEMALLFREAAKQRAHMPVRRLLNEIPTLLSKLKPCLLMSPLSVAQYLNAGSHFDVIVFDEASQIPVWDAVGAIARGKQLIVVGDPKQLPPTNFFNNGDGNDSDFDNEDSPAKDLESILDECLGAALPTLHLEWHYRSKSESLISFSNEHYYDSKLITFPSNVTNDKAVSLVIVPGIYDRGISRTNQIEAEAIVNEIVAHFTDEIKCTLSLGVVTFNQTQQVLIDKLLDDELRNSPELERKIAEHGSDRLFIKNLENVQGDERDVILFSITYGRDKYGKLPMTFGPLNKEGGHRRLNVAITRAKIGIKIFSSINPEDIDLARTRSRGVTDLKHYLEFARREHKTNGPLPSNLSKGDSYIESEIMNALRSRGWVIHSKVGVSGYRIDLAIVHPGDEEKYMMGIELDGPSYHAVPTVGDRDRLRKLVLEGLGWNLHRVWSADWLADKEKELAKIESKLEKALAAGSDSTSA